ncbi:hypothetical protein A4X13_0g7643 [Tilletia indica]|uniref:DUF7729 domain-containing protein n=1 Tax=Tilletia indica TaxID=43049 RepID=A0A177TG06_9BASI|nr:hypothetical protein A4X13_0g7643 [Tilletia indica]
MRVSGFTVAVTAILGLGALPALSQSVIGAGAQQLCVDFLKGLDNDDSLDACITPIKNATDLYTSTSTTKDAASAANLTSTLGQLCASGGLVDQCNEGALKQNLFNFWSNCQQDIVAQTPGVFDSYDFLYLLTPFKKAICQKDSDGNYCLLNVAKAAAAPSSRRRSAEAEVDDDDEDAKDIDVTSAPVELAEGEEDEDDKDIDVTHQDINLTPAERRERYHADLARRLRMQHRKRQAAPATGNGGEDVTDAANDTTPEGAQNVAFLFVKPTSSKDILCSECTQNILAGYIQFEVSVPYAVGLASSTFMAGQSALYAKTKEVCGAKFVSSVNTIANTTIFQQVGAGRRGVDVAASGVGIAMAALVVGGLGTFVL